MVVLPSNFTSTKYPGYFWNTATKKLYSIKVGGVLKEMKYREAGSFMGQSYEAGYRISVNGRKRLLKSAYLNSLKQSDVIEVIGVNHVN